jgi:glycosyltransferase involved in cell wall biosynthesis
MSIRNEGPYIYQCLESIFSQTILPDDVCIIEDGSTDNTVEIIAEFQPLAVVKGIQFRVYHTYSKEKDYTRLGSLWNMGLSKDFDYHLIMSGDCVIEDQYVERLMSSMDHDEKLVAASGDLGEIKGINQPWGACRLVKNSWFFRYIGGYPRKLGYESYIIELALNLQFRTAIFKDIKFKHLRPLGNERTFIEEGRQMRNLGYHPLYALLRIISQRSFSKSLQMLFGYIFYYEKHDNPYYEKFDEQFREQLSKRQYGRLTNTMKGLFKLNQNPVR